MTITLDKMNVMVDLETLGTSSNSVIISVGAFEGVAHNALDDARHQTRHLLKIAGVAQ